MGDYAEGKGGVGGRAQGSSVLSQHESWLFCVVALPKFVAIKAGNTNYFPDKQNGLWMFPCENPFAKQPLSRISAKAAGS